MENSKQNNKPKTRIKKTVTKPLYSMSLKLIDTIHKSTGNSVAECFKNLEMPPIKVGKGELKVTKGDKTIDRYLHARQMRKLFHGLKPTIIYQELLGKHIETWFKET